MPARTPLVIGRERQSRGWKRVLKVPSPASTSRPSPLRIETVVPAFFLILVFIVSSAMLTQRISAPLRNEGGNDPAETGPEDSLPPSFSLPPTNPASNFSFDIEQAHYPHWMAVLPNDVSLAALSIPGTHDTLTHQLADSHPRLQCQNHNLSTQLEAGIRYIDVRARLNISRSSEQGPSRPGNLLIYHSSAWTGYSFTDVMTTIFSFLDANPTETIIMRLQREGPPVHVDPDGKRTHRRAPGDLDETPWVIDRRGKSWGADPAFEAAFNYYRTTNPDTASGFEKHFYLFPSALSEDGKKVPTLGQARGKVVMLQDFDGAGGSRNVYGLPWDESDPRLVIEDLWILTGPRDIERKWMAVREALEEAATDSDNMLIGPLYLSHLSASVAVDPVDVATGTRDPDDNEWHEGINDRTGNWLDKRNDAKDKGKTGVLMADFPGKRLIEAIMQRNMWALPKVDGGDIDASIMNLVGAAKEMRSHAALPS